MEPTIEESIIDESQLINDDTNKENDEVESINEDPSSLIEGKIFDFGFVLVLDIFSNFQMKLRNNIQSMKLVVKKMTTKTTITH